MFEQYFMPWILFLSTLYMLFVIGFMNTSNGNNLQILLWKFVPAIMTLALTLAWLLNMGFVLAPQ